MLTNVSRSQLMVAWMGSVVVLFALSAVWGAPTGSSAALWILAGVAPPMVMLLVWRAPAPTVAEVLFDATHPSTDGRQ